MKGSKRMKKKKVEVPVEKTEEKYTVSGNNISWKYKRGVIELTVDALDQIFYEYSKHGLNMSAVQVQNKNGFDALQWQSVKRTFDLVKDSDVFSPYSLALVSKKEACDLIANKIAEKYSPKNMRDVIAYEDSKQKNKAYSKAIKIVASAEYQRHQFENGLLEYITEAKTVPVVRTSKDVRDGHAIVHVCDLHTGAEIEAERNLPAFNADTIARRLSEVARDTNSRKPKKVTLIINGDLIETFTGLNHINSWKNIDKKYGYGVQATIKATDILTKFISEMVNLDKVIIISGNHDRNCSDNKEDTIGEIAQWIHYMIQARFGKKFPVIWSKDVYSEVIDGCGFVATHGHLSISKKNPDHIVNQYGFAGLYNLVLMAHLHTRKVLSDNLNNRTIHAPSIFTGNQYSKGLGYSTLAGYLYITVKNKYPVVLDYPLP